MRPPDRTPLGGQPWEKNFSSLSCLHRLVRTRLLGGAGAGESDLSGYPIGRQSSALPAVLIVPAHPERSATPLIPTLWRQVKVLVVHIHHVNAARIS